MSGGKKETKIDTSKCICANCKNLPERLSNDEIIGYVYRSKKYDNFQYINVNRELDKNHVKSLRASMARRAYNKPVLVTTSKENRYQIIDGQHTIEVRTQLSKFVPYVILTDEETNNAVLSDDYKIEALKDLNATSKKWRLKDYVNLYAQLMVPDYVKLVRLIDDYPGLEALELYIILGQNGYDKRPYLEGGSYSYIKEGLFEYYADEEEVIRKTKMLFDFKNLSIFKNANFKLALLSTFFNSNYNHHNMLVKLSNNQDRLRPRGKKEEYLNDFEEIYNKHLKCNQVYFAKDYREKGKRARRLQAQRNRERKRLESKNK